MGRAVSGRRSSGPGSFPLVLEPVQARAIARRAKTQLRRTTTIDPLTGRPRACGLKSGLTYRVQPAPDAEPLARIVVTDLRLQRLGDMTTADAQAEGHPSMVAFSDWFLCRHAHGWPPQEEKLCGNCHGHTVYTDHHGDEIACTLCDEVGTVRGDVPLGDPPRDPAGLAARFFEFVDRHVWVVSFMLDDRRFLHRDSSRGYTSDPREALEEEPEVIGDPLPVWKVRGETARRRDRQAVDSTRLSGLPTIDDQLAELRRMAAERGVDLTRERHVLDKGRAAIERKIEEAA